METVPADVLEAFGCEEIPKRLSGGEGNSFLVGNTVLKFTHNAERTEWASDLLFRTPQAGFRISRPKMSREGSFIYAGWEATSYEPGEHVNGRFLEKLTVCRAFHAALHTLTISSALPASNDRWTRAHQIAWQEVAMPEALHPEIRQLITPIFQSYQHIERTQQIIHSDICGNILFAPDLEPLVIDFSPAYGPSEYAEAILVADAMAWENAPVSLAEVLPQTAYIQQLLLRAINFRLIVAALFWSADVATFEKEYNNFLPLLQHIA
ncbi:MAG: hypothetical protein AAF614_09660 [Chloroflexota bacterium]